MYSPLERAEECESIADQLDGIEVEEPDDDDEVAQYVDDNPDYGDGTREERIEQRREEVLQERLDEAVSAVSDLSYDGS